MSVSRISTPRRLVLLALTAVCAFGLLAGEAQARSRQTTVTGPNGATANRNVLREHGDVASSTTGPNGKTSSRVVDRSRNGTTATVTGPDGNSASRTTTR